MRAGATKFALWDEHGAVLSKCSENGWKNRVEKFVAPEKWVEKQGGNFLGCSEMEGKDWF